MTYYLRLVPIFYLLLTSSREIKLNRIGFIKTGDYFENVIYRVTRTVFYSCTVYVFLITYVQFLLKVHTLLRVHRTILYRRFCFLYKKSLVIRIQANNYRCLLQWYIWFGVSRVVRNTYLGSNIPTGLSSPLIKKDLWYTVGLNT